MDSKGNDDGMWFAPKRYGLGAGLPIAWQGWALLGGYLALVLGLAHFVLPLPGLAARVATFALIALATGLLIVVSRSKTRGGWRWRWGGD